MTLFKAHGKILHFSHVPKAGGTSVTVTIHQSGARRAMVSKRPIGMRCTPQHMHAELFNALIPQQFCDASMAVVRNPYDRIASEYDYRCQIHGEQPPFAEWLDMAIAAYQTDKYTLDNHIRPQQEFIGPKTKVFRLEDGLQHPVTFACTLLRLEPVDVPHKKRGTGTAVNAHATSIKIIRDFYAEDFDAFGYNPDLVPVRLSG